MKDSERVKSWGKAFCISGRGLQRKMYVCQDTVVAREVQWCLPIMTIFMQTSIAFCQTAGQHSILHVENVLKPVKKIKFQRWGALEVGEENVY